MTIWWNSLTGIEQFFALVAIPATLILAIQTITLILGFGGNSDFDSGPPDLHHGDVGLSDGHGHDHSQLEIQDHGLQIFSIRGFVAFFSIFGWCGLACLKGGLGVPLSLIISFVSGLASMVLIALLLKAILSAQSDGTISLTNAVGKSASVYMRIPAGRMNRGKVNVTVQGSFIEADAVTDEAADLLPGQMATVIGMVNSNTLLVAAKK